MKSHNDIKVVAKNGQICLGKDFAGQTVQITKNPDHSITIVPVLVLPATEQWLLNNNGIERLNNALKWSESHKRNSSTTESIIDRLEQELNNDKN